MLRVSLLLAFTTTLTLGAASPSFRIFTTQDGLIRNWVTKIHRDSKGYLWLCTVEGISLFDGQRFTNFSTRDGLPSRLVADMIETRQGTYWFATLSGLARFHNDHGSAPAFETIRVGDSKESNDVQRLYEGHDGTIWCATAAGLYRFRPQDGESGPQITPLGGSASLEVRALVEDSRRNLWAATSRGLFRRRPNGDVDPVLTPFPLTRINSMLVDAHDRLWAGGLGLQGSTGPGLAGIDTKSEPPRVLPPEDIPDKTPGLISVLYLGERGEIWVGKSTGLVRIRPDASPPDALFYKPSDAFPFDQVGAIGQDVRHNLWMAAGTLGAVRIDAGSFERFTQAEGLQTLKVSGLVEGFRGTLYAVQEPQWILNEFRGGRFVPIPLQVPMAGATWAISQALVQDREGAWWAASGAGVVRYAAVKDARDLKGKQPERVYSVQDGLPSSTILRVFRDSRDDIWAGTTDGVGHWTRATGRWQAFRTADMIPGSKGRAAVHSFAEDSSGVVWAGMYPTGLVRFRGTGCESVTREVPRGAINALLSDRRGRLWIGSSQGGVGRMEHPATAEPDIQPYGPEQGLSSDHVFSLSEDSGGRIYVAGGRGVDRLDPDSGTLRHFTSSNGLPPGETQFVFHDLHDNIWFASFYGLTRYRPEPDQHWETPVPLVRALRVGGDSYPISELGSSLLTGVDLAPGHNSLEVEFRALHFDIGEVLRYQYRLGGSDARWSKPSDVQMVHYANLAPGRYHFAVRSVTESGLISAGEASLSFEVLPVFWRKDWFLALVALAMVAGALSLHQYRLNHVLALEQVRTRLAADLHDDLGAGLAEIAILSEVAKLQARPRTLEILDGIAGRARALREAMTDIVWTVDPREDCLADLVLRLRQTAFTMLENEERSVEFVAPGNELLQIVLTPALRRHVLLFFKEAVTNVARHAGATAVRVEIQAAKGHFRMLVRDNGCGFDPGQHRAGHGLKSLEYRAGELHGGFHVQSAPETGTEIELTLQL